MAAPSATGMEKGEMRALIKKAAPDNPINFAFGQGKDGGFALLKMDKIKNPKACGKMLSEEFADAKNTRWGTLTVDPDIDSAMVRFTVNKAVSGMAKRLTKTLKGTGFSKVEILLEDGTVVEGSSGEDEEEQESEQETEQQPEATAAPQPGANNQPEPQAAEEPAPNAPDPAASAKTLAALLKRIPAAIASDPSAKERLLPLATTANAALKGADPSAATAAIEALTQALDSPAAPPSEPQAAPEPQPDPAALTKSLGDLMKQVPAAIAATPGAKAELIQLATAANTQLKARDLEAAAASIDSLRTALQSATNPESETPESESESNAEELRARIQDVAAQAAQLPGPAKADLQARAKQLLAAPTPSETDIDALENDLAAAAKAARAAEAQQQSGSTVSYRILHAEWRSAQAASRTQLDAFIKTMLADKDVQAHPNFAELQAATGAMIQQMPEFGDGIEGALAAIDDAEDDNARAAARAAARKMLAEYDATLEGADGLRELEEVADDEFGGSSFFTELREALDFLGDHLEEAS